MRILAALFLLLAIMAPVSSQELRGHGGPIRAIAISADGRTAMTASFDQSSIRWNLATASAEAIFRFHEGAVSTVIALDKNRFATGGEDGRIAIWSASSSSPERIFTHHVGPVSGLAVSPDGMILASSSWDGMIRLTVLSDAVSGEANAKSKILSGHKGPVSAIAFTAQGSLVSAGHDATLRIWTEAAQRTVQLEAVQNAIAIAPEGEIITAGASGQVMFFNAEGIIQTVLDVVPVPLVAMALSADGTRIAAGGLQGQVPLIDRRTRSIKATLVGPGLPVWSLAFTPDGQTLLSGGADRLVRRWNAVTGEHLGAVTPQATTSVMAGLENERGAVIFRACAACHTLTPEDGNRAGPTLHGLFGRKIATAPGYAYSTPLTRMDIVWGKDTISRLFEIGPNAYTPGTKMPEQTLSSAEDRKALVDWLEQKTRK
jgi:cytochrome c